MALKDLMDKAQGLAGSATDMAGKLVDEFNEALPTMRALGFTIRDIRVGMGLTPDIGAKLVASADGVDPQKIKELIEKHTENKTLVTALKALQLAYNVRHGLGDPPCKNVEIDVTLGLPPRVSVAFVSNAPAAALTAAGSAGA